MRRFLFIAILACFALSPAAAQAGPQHVHVTVFARTGMNMDSIVWTGSEFLYVVNTMNTLWSAPPAGLPITQIATMPQLVEETRCVLSPGTHGFPAGVIFCHSPDNKVYEISLDGAAVSVFATLPAPAAPVSDGALIFDTVGRFGYGLVAATGRSGSATPSGGTVYTISASGQVKAIGGYKGPGGADEVMIAPTSLGPLPAMRCSPSTPARVAVASPRSTRAGIHAPSRLSPVMVRTPSSRSRLARTRPVHRLPGSTSRTI